jgi:Tfp pilus assembly protein PilO
MKGSDKAIVFGVLMAVVLAVFYFKVLSPKREQASSLKSDVADLQSQIDQQTQAANFGEDARRHFPEYYGRLVVLGKAVPADADSASLLVELNSIADRTGVKFQGLQLSANSGTDASSAASSTTSSSSTSSSSSSATTGTTATTSTTPSTSASTSASAAPATPTAATESTAANLPLGASVGSAGLPVMPYDLTFEGEYFQVADFLKSVDDLVHLRGSSQVAADGRLLTIDAFDLSPAGTANGPNPKLTVDLTVTSYLTPNDQGLTAGATPGGPAPSLTQPQTQPASATVTP